jgi:hypothetical protein
MRVPQKAKATPTTTWVVTLLYALIAVIMTYPVAFKLSSAVAGGAAGDNFQRVWSLWWSKKAWLDLGTSVGDLQTLYYPTGAYHTLLAAEPYVQLLALPLVSLFGPLAAYNVEFLLSFLLRGLTMYLLCEYITRNRWAAFIGGLIFGFFPSQTAHAVSGHFGQIMTYWFPLYALFLFKLFARPDIRNALLCGLFLALSLTVYLMHIAYFVAPFTLLFLVMYCQRLSDARVIKGFVGASLLAALLSAPFLLPIVVGKLSGQMDYLGGKGGMTVFSVDLLAFLIPPPYHPVLSLWEEFRLVRRIVYAESMAYLGLTALGLALWGLKRKKSEARFWLILGISTAVLSLGPFLKVGGELVRYTIEDKESYVVLPYALLTKVPFFEWGRTPSRLSGTMSFALAVLASLGAGDILPRLKTQWGRAAFVGGIALLVLFEYVAIFPFPMAGGHIPDFYRKTAKEPEEYAILDLPIEGGGSTGTSNQAMYYQMFHGHRIVGGFIYRFPAGAKELTRLMGQLAYRPLNEDIVAYPPSEESLAALSRLGVRYVVVHKFSPIAADVVASLQQSLGQPLFEDRQITAFATPQENDRLPVEAIPFLDEEDNWGPLESWEGVPSRWMGNDGLIYFYLPEEGKYRLRFTAYTDGNQYTNLQVFINEQPSGKFVVRGWQSLVTPVLRLEKGLNVARFHLPGYFVGNQESKDQTPVRNMLFQEVDILPVALPSRWSPSTLDIEQHVEIKLGDKVKLLGYNIEGSLRPGDHLRLTLFWQALSKMDRDYTVFTHLVDGKDRIWGQKDNPPVDGFYPTTQWEKGEIVRDQYNLVISPDAPPGEYQIEVGMYLAETGERLDVRREEGPLPEKRILLSPPVTIR